MTVFFAPWMLRMKKVSSFSTGDTLLKVTGSELRNLMYSIVCNTRDLCTFVRD